MQGELDVLAVPANVAAILYNQTEGGVVLLAAGTLGVLYIVEKGGETVTDIASLNGKTIYATGKGATPEYALTYLLSQHGLTLGEDVQVEWKSEPTEIVALMAEQDNAVAMLPQPFVTVAQSQVEGLRVALDLSAEWDALDNGSRLVTSVLVARKAFADEHPAALAAFWRTTPPARTTPMSTRPRPLCWWRNMASSRPPWRRRRCPSATWYASPAWI